MGNQLTRMFIPVSNSSPRQRQSLTEKIGERIFSIAPSGESKGMTSSPSENKCPTAEKLLKTSGVTMLECHDGNGKKELHPDGSDTSKEQAPKENDEKLRKKEQELQEKEKEIEELKREKENAQQQALENEILTARIKELEEEIERLKAEIKKLKEELEKQKEESEKQKEELEKLKEESEKQKKEFKEIKGNEHNLQLAAMCDQLQKNFYQIVFYPYDFSKEKQSYKVVNIERDIKYGFYGLTTEGKKRQATERWTDLMKKLGWTTELHLSGILQLKQDRIPTAHPKITKDMKEGLEDGAKALNDERKLDEPTFGIVKNLIKMWLETVDLVQEQEKKKNKEQWA